MADRTSEGGPNLVVRGHRPADVDHFRSRRLCYDVNAGPSMLVMHISLARHMMSRILLAICA